MSSTNGTTTTSSTNMTDSNPAVANSSKGKGKAIETAPPQQDMSMDEDEDSSDEETGAEDDVYLPICPPPTSYSIVLVSIVQRTKTKLTSPHGKGPWYKCATHHSSLLPSLTPNLSLSSALTPP